MQVLTDLKSKKVVSPDPFRDQAIPNYSYVMLDFRAAAARTVLFRASSL